MTILRTLNTTRAYLGRELRRPKVLVAVLAAVLLGAIGLAKELGFELWSTGRAAQLEQQREEARQREQVRVVPELPEDLAFDVNRKLRLITYRMSITNTGDSDVVIDLNHFVRIPDLPDDTGFLHLSPSLLRVQIIDASSGQALPAHRRLPPKGVLDVRIEAIRPASDRDLQTVVAARRAGLVGREGEQIVDIPLLAGIGRLPQSLRMSMDPRHFHFYVAVRTSLGHLEQVRLGRI